MLGILPITPGYATWLVQAHPGSLAWANGTAPTAHGAIGVTWKAGSTFSMTVTAPKDTSGTIAVPTTKGKFAVVILDGRIVWALGHAILASGVKGAHQDEAFVYLPSIGSGSHTVIVR